MQRRIHKRSIPFRSNAGIDFPVCKKGARLLDMDATGWETTGNNEEVTCLNCRREVAKNRWA